MKTNMATTSLQAYAQLEDEGKLTAQRQLVLAAVRELGTACNLDISEHTGIPINAVSSSSNWLVKNGRMVLDRKDASKQTGRMAQFWKINDQPTDAAGNPMLLDVPTRKREPAFF